MRKVRAKKHLGQHFLTDLNIAQRIVESISLDRPILEIGPGMGVLTQFLVKQPGIDLSVVEIDRESIVYLDHHFPELRSKTIKGDFLQLNPKELFSTPFSIIGNFPYNISSQIFFKVLENKNQIPEVVGMIQKEVAERLASPPNSRAYGILSVLLQAYYNIEYLFTVDAHVFSPPPKVQSAVIKLTRNETVSLDCDEVLFKRVIKATFNQRRKTIRNSLKVIPFDREAITEHPLLSKRPEHLSVAEFVVLTNLVDQNPLKEESL